MAPTDRDHDLRVIPEIVDSAPPPSEWGAEFTEELRRLVAPLFRVPSAVASLTCSTT